jgi:ubiquinone/menaquinone biosynthesis C-methylase UbiE/DNA-binding transcriptional ArsR family regulator
MSPLRFEALLDALRGVGETTRLRILALLSEAELTVTDLTDILRQSQPVVSRHLKVLSDAGVVERFREGSWAFFRLAADAPAAALVQSLVRHLDPADPIVAHDRQRLASVRTERASQAQEYFSRYAEEWDHLRTLHVPDDQVERAIKDVIGTRSIPALLDVGTGTGHMLELLGPQANRGVGIDMSREMLAIARTKLASAGLQQCGVQLGDLYDMPFAPNSFDVVVVHQILHLLDDAPGAIAEASRVLRPGGRLIVIDFAPHTIEALRDQHAHRRLGFATDTVSSWMVSAGLDVVSERTVTPLPDSDGRIAVSIWLGRDPRLAATRNPLSTRNPLLQGASL